ncbi:MAG: dihydrolipoyl dehydrogenase [Deltaproteobacteria bacterium]|nr:MAG: dihydrolipoyl dehydrogenase [Deltaproteobacteria bacterium]
MNELFDLVVIGGGPGGYVAALRAAQLGMKVAVVEKRAVLGGTCLNEGCIPSKALLDSSEYFALARDGFQRHGIVIEPPRLDLAQMMRRKDEVVVRLTRGIASLFKKHGIRVVTGTGRLTRDEGTPRVAVATAAGEELLAGKHVLLATGSEAVALPGLPFGGPIGAARDALAYDQVPEHLVVVGGGYIGLELGSVWLRLGAKVTVVEMLDQLLPNTDQEVARTLVKSLEKQGMTILPGTRVTGADSSGNRVTLQLEGKHPQTLTCDRILVAAGRRPCTEGLGLETVGITLEQGRIPVDADYRTGSPGVYAVGDLIAGPMLAHKAMDEAVACIERLHGGRPEVDYRLIPGVIYTVPEAAAVGRSEEQLKSDGVAYAAGRFPFMASGRAKALDETEGFVKVLTAPGSGRILGVHILGPRASELIAEAAAVMAFAGSIEDVAAMTHAHPTLAEAFREAALGAAGRAVHL